MFKYFLPAATTLTPRLAQGINATDFACLFTQGSPSIADVSSPGASVNSTGSVAFSFRDQDPWYLSVPVNNTAPGVNRFSRESFFSVPDEAQDASVCLYQFSALNATSTSDRCAGVFSTQCMGYLWHRLYNDEIPVAAEGECLQLWPSSRDEQQRLRERSGSISGNAWTCKSIHVVHGLDIDVRDSNTTLGPYDTCNYPSLPGVDLPDGYQTLFSSAGMEGTYSFFGDEPASTYDQFAQQVVPFVITIPKPSDSEVLFMCVTPNNTQAGSQELGRKPWEKRRQAGKSQINLL
ncbi:hypothetical protein E8E11_000446 [Didymella keratinophila]|nr:hypothetical protein E8E11_000446 [Didymella keratinophila]